MSKSNKIVARLLSRPRDFTFSELEGLLVSLGFVLSNTGHSSGSAVRFINHDTGQILRLHKPHPNPELKPYLIKYIISELKKGGHIGGK